MKIRTGQIWEVVTDSFFTSGKDGKDTHKRPVKLAKGDKIEIRFPCAWHFRTEDGFYLHAEPEMIDANCSLIGDILGDIRMRNRANLEEILRLGLYIPVEANKNGQ